MAMSPRCARFLPLALLGLLACGGGGDGGSRTAPPQPPTIEAFQASKGTLVAGEACLLTWNVTGAERLSLEPGDLDLTVNDGVFVVPQASASYTLRAANADGSASRSLSLQVSGAFPAHQVDHQALLEDLRQLSSPALGGRVAGTPGGARARAMLAARLQAFGYAVTEAPWTRQGYLGTNVCAQITGSSIPDEVILVSAHYDHIAASPGADDNGSGAAALLRLAQYLKAHPPAHTVLFALFDGEEEGLLGSEAFVADPPVALARIRLVLNLDMMGRSDFGSLGVLGTRWSPALKPFVEAAAQPLGLPLTFGYDGSPEDLTPYSDQYPFHLQGIPFLFLCDIDHPDYHTSRDTYRRISADFYGKGVETALGLLRALDARSDLATLLPRITPLRPLGAPFPLQNRPRVVRPAA